jgi:hypothetical protein
MPSILTTLAALAFAGISTTAFIIWIAERSRPDTAGDSVFGDVVELHPEAKRRPTRFIGGGMAEAGRAQVRTVCHEIAPHNGSFK